MQFYLAPLEGITGFVYRNSLNKYFTGLDKYFMPFLSPKSYGYLSAREKEELAPDNNQGLNVVPQTLTNDAEDFLKVAKCLQEFGYKEVNLNMGCPSKPVVNKGRGAGFLAMPKLLDEFLTEIFEKCNMNVSIKTRMGMNSADEFAPLLEIFNKYPVQELIVHPRVGTDFYGNQTNKKVFGEALSGSKASVCYNGDIRYWEDYKSLIAEFRGLDKVMIGRGLICNPFLVEEIANKSSGNDSFIDRGKFWNFHNDVLENYQRVIPSDMELTVLFKMKELWRYMKDSFDNGKEWQRRINKTKNIVEYKCVIERMENLDEIILVDDKGGSHK